MSFKIITNNKPRPVIYFDDLTNKEKKEFKWCNGEGCFFRYRGNAYILAEFVVVEKNNKELAGWDGVAGDSYFSGTLVKISEDNDFVTVGRYTC